MFRKYRERGRPASLQIRKHRRVAGVRGEASGCQDNSANLRNHHVVLELNKAALDIYVQGPRLFREGL